MQHSPRAPRPCPATRAALAIALLGAAALGGCRKEAEKEEPKPTAAAPAEKKAKPAALPAPAKPKPVLKKLLWDDPQAWKKVPPTSAMRVASYQIPPTAGDKEIAEMNVFVLGGDVESNIQRWVDEFSKFDPKSLSRTDRVVNDMSESVVEIANGTYSGGMGSDSASENFALLGGIVVTPEDAKYFFKLTGPSATVKAARAAFYGLLDSVRLEGGTAAPASAKTLKTVGGSAPSAAPTPEAAGSAPPPAPTKH
jgi:hypothetical protein